MDLLPKDVSDFGAKKYWEEFFKHREGSFEWYGSYEELSPVLERYLKPADRILQIGCGSSQLAEQLYDNGYRKIVSIDRVDQVIRKKQRENEKSRPELEWRIMDATQMEFEAGSFTVVLDKGTLDALIPTSESVLSAASTIDGLFSEVDRVLVPGIGRYLTITLAQDHVSARWLQHFALDRPNYMLRIHRAPKPEKPNQDQRNVNRPSFDGTPVFFMIGTKLKMTLFDPIFEFWNEKKAGFGKAERKSRVIEVMQSLKAVQEYSWFCQKCRNRMLKDQMQICLKLDGENNRYDIIIVDDITNHLCSYAVMVVPHGRETEWLFSTDKGRIKLVQQTGYQRLAIVRLVRGQKYTSLDAVKLELNSFVMDFAQRQVIESNKIIQYLSVTDDVGSRVCLEKGRSLVSGDFVVEDVKLGENFYRRFVFMNSPNIVQSEGIIEPTVPTAPSVQTLTWKVDCAVLCNDYHKAMVLGLALADLTPDGNCSLAPNTKHKGREASGNYELPPEKCRCKFESRILIVGVGCGSLAMYLYERFPKMDITGVDVDSEVMEAGKRWFGLAEDHRLKLFVGDGIKFMEKEREKKVKYDVIFVDVGSAKLDSHTLLAPPDVFLEDYCLQLIRDLIEPYGCLGMNVITRSDETAARVRKKIDDFFPTKLSETESLEGNEILLCLPYAPENLEAWKSEQKSRTEKLREYLARNCEGETEKNKNIQRNCGEENSSPSEKKQKKKKKRKSGKNAESTKTKDLEEVIEHIDKVQIEKMVVGAELK